MDVGYTSKHLPSDHSNAIATSEEFQDKKILIIVNVLVDFTEISKIIPPTTSSIEYPSGFTTQDYLIISADSISFIKSHVKSKKPLYCIHTDSLADFSHTKRFLNNKIRLELKNSLRTIEFRIIDNQEFNNTVEILRNICPPPSK
jgi:mitochondrial fission protein ELM1